MPGNTSETKLVNFAMANATRRKIINFLANGDKDIEEIGGIVGRAMLDFHLKILQQASLIALEEGTAQLSEYGKNFLKSDKENDTRNGRSSPGKTNRNCRSQTAFALHSRFVEIQGNCKYGSSPGWNLENP